MRVEGGWIGVDVGARERSREQPAPGETAKPDSWRSIERSVSVLPVKYRHPISRAGSPVLAAGTALHSNNRLLHG